MIFLGACLPSALQHAWTTLIALGQRLLLANLVQPLIGQRPSDSSHSPARRFVVSTRPFPSFRNTSRALEHLHVAIYELENSDPLDLDQVKLRWRVLIQLTTSILQA